MQPKKPQDAVQFTFESAQRIARVVRAAENAAPSGSPLVFRKVFPSKNSGGIASATFSGVWATGSTQTITFKYKSGTAVAHNDLISLPHAASRNVIVGREGTAWRLINWQQGSANVVYAATLTTDSLKLTTIPVPTIGTATANIVIGATACA